VEFTTKPHLGGGNVFIRDPEQAMPAARITLSMFVLLVLATGVAASPSCMSKSEARQHFGAVPLYWHGRSRCWDATAARREPRIQKALKEANPPKWRDAMSKIPADAQQRVPANVSNPLLDRWVDVGPSPVSPLTRRWVDITPVKSSAVEPKAAPLVTPQVIMLGLIAIAIALTLAIIEFLFRREDV
jgi:hypothetical protein